MISVLSSSFSSLRVQLTDIGHDGLVSRIPITFRDSLPLVEAGAVLCMSLVIRLKELANIAFLLESGSTRGRDSRQVTSFSAAGGYS